ncbi:FadR/GntR family transcriptional regulator [Hydrogenophaga sp. BPS33]|uniref:FadR/GntR family transcriptional regulator n=1 Tax=Hydrogenophaga sp. BPS33 TaxID=2651974 RepID=UPI0013585508|nr:FCD domain-containing protein [Hydrogenophaga sp. BPS33]
MLSISSRTVPAGRRATGLSAHGVATPRQPPVRTAERGAKRPHFQPVTGARPAAEIIEQVRSMLRSQELQSGDRLPPERELAEQLQVSRNTVRQALRSLQEQGLLEIRHGPAGGAVIRSNGGTAVEAVLGDLFSLGTIRPQDLTEVRVLIGTEVVHLACQRASEAEFDQLEANVAAAEEAIRQNDLARRTELNLEFHKLLARMTGNALLVAITDAVIAITREFVSRIERTPSSLVMPFRRRLLRSLRARDAVASTDAIRRHLLRQQTLYLKEAARLSAAETTGGQPMKRKGAP